jgi:hypothetical protein
MTDRHPEPLTDKQVEELHSYRNAGLSIREIVQLTNISRTRILRHIDEYWQTTSKPKKVTPVMPDWVVFENITKSEARQVRNKRS